MDSIEKNLLAEISDLHSVPEGAYNIRNNGKLEARNTTANIDIVTKKDKPGIDIYVKPGTKNESMHIPVILSESGLKDLVYNDFYIGEGKYPKNPDGSDDYESLESLDLERLHLCLKELYKTGICEAPVFDFTLQQPSGTRHIDARGGVVIIEGLHALNPALTEELPAGAALCLYAGLREEYADSSDACCLATRDIRLARRIVRDYLFRGHGAAFTLGLWGHVCAGEERFIKPYKPRANLLLDTTHTYEVCLWRTVLDAMPADPELTPVQARQLEALRARFDAFPALGTELVPQNSLLREFIGK